MKNPTGWSAPPSIRWTWCWVLTPATCRQRRPTGESLCLCWNACCSSTPRTGLFPPTSSVTPSSPWLICWTTHTVTSKATTAATDTKRVGLHACCFDFLQPGVRESTQEKTAQRQLNFPYLFIYLIIYSFENIHCLVAATGDCKCWRCTEKRDSNMFGFRRDTCKTAGGGSALCETHVMFISTARAQKHTTEKNTSR